MTNFKGDYVTIDDVKVAKNYLSENELNKLNLLVSGYLDYAELQTLELKPMKMQNWRDLKRKLKQEGSQLHENIVQLKMKAQDGKLRETDTFDTKGIFRLIESVPSPKAEPFKLWLASLGSERIDEVFDPELAVNRVVNYYRSKGYTDEWIYDGY